MTHLADPDHNTSFTKGVFLGEIREDLVFPFPQLAADEKESLGAIIDAFRAWAADAVDPRLHDREAAFAPGVREGMAELGLMGLNIPEEYGGFGASAILFTRMFGEVGAIDPALAVYFGAHQSIGCKGITLFGTDEQKRRWLPRCASGECVAAFCLTESGSGSDAQAMRTHARLSDDGTHYILRGEKIWISNAGFAGVFTVFAQVDTVVDGKTKKRVTAFIVDAKLPGISLGKLEDKMGIKASDTRTVTFADVKVPVSERLGAEGEGFRIALEILNTGRLGLAAASTRGVHQIMQLALAHAKQREQFGRPIGSFEMIQRKFAMSAADCYASDAGWMLTASMMDRGGVDFSLETAACKIFASELVYRATNDAMQIAGGIGFSKEYPYEQAVRDCRINLIFEGTNEILRALIALSGLQQPGEQLKELGKALSHPLQSMGVIGSYLAGRAKRQLIKPKFAALHDALKHEGDLVETGVHDFALGVERVLITHGKEVIERQFHQERLANAAIDIYLSTAVLSRANAALNAASAPEAAGADLDHARTFIPAAMRRVRRSVRALSHNQDERLKAIAERALESGELTLPAPTDQ